MALFLWVCLGGAAGTGARYVLSTWIGGATGSRFPFATLTVNVIGSFLLGAILSISTGSDMLSDRWRVALVTGVMGGFTTYSTFNQETIELIRQGAGALGLANVAATVLGSLAAGVLGLGVGRWLAGP